MAVYIKQSPPREGVRGGWEDFKWDSLKTQSHADRDYYLGASAKVGICTRGKFEKYDWWTKKKEKETPEDAADEELRRVRRFEQQLLDEALGQKPRLLLAGEALPEEEVRKKEEAAGVEGPDAAKALKKLKKEHKRLKKLRKKEQRREARRIRLKRERRNSASSSAESRHSSPRRRRRSRSSSSSGSSSRRRRRNHSRHERRRGRSGNRSPRGSDTWEAVLRVKSDDVQAEEERAGRTGRAAHEAAGDKGRSLIEWQAAAASRHRRSPASGRERQPSAKRRPSEAEGLVQEQTKREGHEELRTTDLSKCRSPHTPDRGRHKRSRHSRSPHHRRDREGEKERQRDRYGEWKGRRRDREEEREGRQEGREEQRLRGREEERKERQRGRYEERQRSREEERKEGRQRGRQDGKEEERNPLNTNRSQSDSRQPQHRSSRKSERQEGTGRADPSRSSVYLPDGESPPQAAGVSCQEAHHKHSFYATGSGQTRERQGVKAELIEADRAADAGLFESRGAASVEPTNNRLLAADAALLRVKREQ
ncbi:hypothetical protein Efla_006731 [Eimeria flavescens]